MTRTGSAVGVALLAAALSACGAGVEYRSTETPQEAPGVSDFSAEALNYFDEIAFGAEYGDGSALIHKWTEDVVIAVHGDPTEEDLVTLKDVVDDLNSLIGTLEVRVGGAGTNVDLYFVPESRFSSIQPEYIPVNMGFFYVWWDANGAITDAQILVSTDRVTQEERNHLIREELTQSMGLMRDSNAYEDSIFYQPWTHTQRFSTLDESLIEMLYLPEVEPGMDRDEASAAIRSPR